MKSMVSRRMVLFLFMSVVVVVGGMRLWLVLLVVRGRLRVSDLRFKEVVREKGMVNYINFLSR